MKPVVPFLLMLLIAPPLHAAVGVSHIVGFGGSPFNEFHVYQTFEKTDYTGFMFMFLSGSTYQYMGSYIDEGLDLYRTSAGAAFAPGTVSNGSFTPFVYSSNYVLTGDFFVGLVTPSKDSSFATLPPAYGWARLRSSNGVLSLVDHAIDYSGNGLIVGTTTVVPEPGSGILFVTAACGLLHRRRRDSEGRQADASKAR